MDSNRPTINDEQLKKMMKAQEPSFMQKYGSCIVTLVLIAICIVVYLIEVLFSGLNPNVSTYVLFNMGAMYAPAIESPLDWYRFVAPMFLHVDLMHLLFNMAALYSCGVLLERILGRWNYLALYLIAGISGNALCYFVDVMTGSYYVSAGASTSIFGLFVATALLGILSKRDRAFFMQYGKGMLGVIAINLVFTFLAPSISISGHLGGAVGGLVAMFMIPSKNLRVPIALRIVAWVIWVMAIGHVLGMSVGVSLLSF